VILVVLAALCILAVPLFGGRLSRLASLDLHFLWAAPLALALQVLIVTIAPGGSETLHASVHIATYALGGLFLWANRRVRGALVIGAGAALNAFVIVINGGVMPEWRTAQRLAGLTLGAGFKNSAPIAHPHLLWLGDVIPVPAPLSLSNVLSVGDCLIFAGMLILLRGACWVPKGSTPQGSDEQAPGAGIEPAGPTTRWWLRPAKARHVGLVDTPARQAPAGS
jgi:hypothetical protein